MRVAVAAALSLSAAHVAGYTATPMVRPAAVQSQAPRVASAIRMEAVAKDEAECAMVSTEFADNCGPGRRTSAPFKKVMAANRAEIAVRIMRACTELNMETVAIYGYEDRYSQHRWGAEQSFLLEKDATASPISAYLDIDQIITIAKENGVRPSAPQRPPPHAKRCILWKRALDAPSPGCSRYPRGPSSRPYFCACAVCVRVCVCVTCAGGGHPPRLWLPLGVARVRSGVYTAAASEAAPRRGACPRRSPPHPWRSR